jgi:hypothetical protein
MLVLATSCIWLWLGWRWNRGISSLPRLASKPSLPSTGTTLSVIITACDEAQTIAPALRSLLGQSMPGLEFIAVNDRSTDKTGEILDEIAQTDERLRVVHIHELPEGWLGKVHAMARATEVATGDWILYTDADVHFSGEVLGRAVAQAEQRGLDHLTLVPTMASQGVLLDVTVLAFAQMLFHVIGLGTSKRQPFGAGAFNMVRRDTLGRSEGLQWIKMEVADDTGLAFLITNAGGRSDFLTALDELRVEWYPSLTAMFQGLEKNAYILVSQGNVLRLLGALLAGGLAVWGPVLGLLLQPSLAATIAGGGAMLILMGTTLRLRLLLKTRPWAALLAPLGILIIGMVALWSCAQTMRKRGISWRGTFYPLDQLLAGQRVKL